MAAFYNQDMFCIGSLTDKKHNKMKKILYYLSCCILLFAGYSCSTDIDNYDEPQETLKGEVIDKNTMKPMQTEVSDAGIRLKLMEYSWSDNPTPYYFYCKQDGTFNNTKIFKGTYNVVPQGAFVPLVQKDDEGNTILDESRTLEIKGSVDLKFEVEPFLNIEWVGEPVVNSNGSITIQVKVTRGTANAKYHQNVSDIVLFINSSSPYVGDNNYDNRYITKLSGDDANNSLGKTITLTTTGEFSKARTYYVRVGARIDYNVEGSKRYNYNEPKTVPIP